VRWDFKAISGNLGKVKRCGVGGLEMCFSHSKELFLECGGEGVVIFMHSLLSHKRPFFLLQAIFRNNNVLFHIFCSIFKSCKHQNMELVHFPSNLVPQITIFFFFYFK
jgi:hypothetical protein